MPINIDEPIIPTIQSEKLEKPMTEGRKKQSLKHEAQGKSMNRQIIDELLNKARSYPKVEGYLRSLDKRRINEGEDVPVTKREKIVRQADENAAKRLESQVKEPEAYKSEESNLEKGRELDPTSQYNKTRYAKQSQRPDSEWQKEDKTRETGKVKDIDKKMKNIKEALPDMPKEKASKFKKYFYSNKSEMISIIDDLLKKSTYYGVGSREGKISVQGTHKETKNHGSVSSPRLSEARKNEILEGSRKKALTQAEISGLHGQASKLRAAKSIDERTADLVKSLYDIVNHKRFSKIDPDAGIDKEKERKMDLEYAVQGGVVSRSGFKPYGKDNPTMPEHLKSADMYGKNKSIDERTSDLHRGFAPKKIGQAVGNEYVKNPDSEKAKRVAVRFHNTTRGDEKAKEDFGEGMTDAIWAHNLKLAKKSQRDIVNTWQDYSPHITKGSMIMPLGPGGKIQDLSKDDNNDDEGAE